MSVWLEITMRLAQKWLTSKVHNPCDPISLFIVTGSVDHDIYGRYVFFKSHVRVVPPSPGLSNPSCSINEDEYACSRSGVTFRPFQVPDAWVFSRLVIVSGYLLICDDKGL
jgi:hypothetical protein